MVARISTRNGIRRRQGSSAIGLFFLSLSVFGAGFLTSGMWTKPNVEVLPAPVVSEFDTVSVPVVAEIVPVGTLGKDIHFVNVDFPAHQVPQGALLSVESIMSDVTLVQLPARLPIFRENFGRSRSGENPVIESIPPGMRAMTIKVDATAAVEGWAGSGSIVDVLLIEKDKTSVIAEKVKILSAERSVSPVEGRSSPSVPSTVTLLVTQEQCLAINTAIPLGRIAFALRATKDEENWQSTNFSSERLRGAPSLSGRSKEKVSGYAAVSGQEGRAFALAGGQWTKTEVVPDGFLVGRGE